MPGAKRVVIAAATSNMHQRLIWVSATLAHNERGIRGREKVEEPLPLPGVDRYLYRYSYTPVLKINVHNSVTGFQGRVLGHGQMLFL